MPFPGSAGSCWAADTWATSSWGDDTWAGAGAAAVAVEDKLIENSLEFTSHARSKVYGTKPRVRKYQFALANLFRRLAWL